VSAAFRGWVKRRLYRLGYDVMRVSPSDGWQPYYLERLGYTPATIVDVGVGFGTRALYPTFPTAYFVLVEPLAEFEPDVRRILARYRGEYLPLALGSRDEARPIQVNTRWHERSSLLHRTTLEDQGDPKATRVVPVTTLDGVLAERGFQPPFGLKLDVEGAELEVIEGAGAFLRQTQFLIAEVAVARRFEGGYSFAEFIRAMDERRFRLRDILHHGRNDAQEMTFVDAVFEPA
jgi:FkbM family methyltransferase